MRAKYHHNSWALQDAKACLSELVKKTVEAPQIISVRGKPVVVVLSQEAYIKLSTPSLSIVDFFQRSPLRKVKLTIKRDQSTPRTVDL